MIRKNRLYQLSGAFGFISFTILTIGATAQQTSLEGLNSGLIAVSQKTLPCVVRISGSMLLSTDEDDTDRQDENAPAEPDQVLGSGIVVSPDGFIITNAHVVNGLRRVRVSLSLPGGQITKRARIVGVDRKDDIAVIKVTGHELQYMDVSHVAAPEQGEIVLAFGSPFGLEHTVTMGIVSDVGKQTDANDSRLWIQTDAAVNPGNSGGPLVDIHGSLLGINTLVYSDRNGGGNEGIAFAIPAPTAIQIYRQLVEDGRVTRATFGITPMPLTPAIASALGLKPTTGMLVENVDFGSPAERSGIGAGDVLVAINGHRVENLLDYTAVLNGLRPGVSVSLQLWHDQELRTSELIPDVADDNASPLAVRVHIPRNLVRRLEILAVPLDEAAHKSVGQTIYEHGVVIAGRSSTLRIGRDTLQVRDVIYQVNGKNVDTLESLLKTLDEIPHGAPLVLQIERDHALMYVPLEGARE